MSLDDHAMDTESSPMASPCDSSHSPLKRLSWSSNLETPPRSHRQNAKAMLDVDGYGQYARSPIPPRPIPSIQITDKTPRLQVFQDKPRFSLDAQDEPLPRPVFDDEEDTAAQTSRLFLEETPSPMFPSGDCQQNTPEDDMDYASPVCTPPPSPLSSIRLLGHTPAKAPPSPARKVASPFRLRRRDSHVTLGDQPGTPRTLLQPRTALPVHMRDRQVVANRNPFTPRKHGCPPSKSAKSQTNDVARYSAEYVELRVLGEGEFGTVVHARHKLDGMEYAIKKSKQKVSGLLGARILREVFAHAVLQQQDHIVRYFTAWTENGRMMIQNEYCNGGSLAELIVKYQREGRCFPEAELVLILKHVADGLQCMHRKHLVHLDVKPANIFIQNEELCDDALSVDSDADDVFAPPRRCSTNSLSGRTYKLGDLGLVVQESDPQDVEEGDCRYLAREVMQENFNHLSKADIFSLGCTMHELATCQELPRNGPEWHRLRDGDPPVSPRYSSLFNELLVQMLHPDPTVRPSAQQILAHPIMISRSKKSDGDDDTEKLRRQLAAERERNMLLHRQLQSVKAEGATPDTSMTLDASTLSSANASLLVETTTPATAANTSSAVPSASTTAALPLPTKPARLLRKGSCAF
eukprot:m.232526 g.232526  ORF g.232526 m.232526 type:complete len:636 (+) comp15230_c0_seq1:434-2341(+)